MKAEQFQRLPLEARAKEYQAKKDELKLVADVAPHGAQIEVCNIVGISDKYCRDILKRDGAKYPTTDNYTLLSHMVKEYRRINEAEKKKLEV